MAGDYIIRVIAERKLSLQSTRKILLPLCNAERSAP